MHGEPLANLLSLAWCRFSASGDLLWISVPARFTQWGRLKACRAWWGGLEGQSQCQGNERMNGQWETSRIPVLPFRNVWETQHLRAGFPWPSRVREDIPHDDTNIVHGRPSTNPIHYRWHGSVSVWWTTELGRWKGSLEVGERKSQ